MSIKEDIRSFHALFPEAFDQRPFPPWPQDWRVIYVQDPEGAVPQEISELHAPISIDEWHETSIPSQVAQSAPLDALAYYLPFHYYNAGEPDPKWGIYLVHP